MPTKKDQEPEEIKAENGEEVIPDPSPKSEAPDPEPEASHPEAQEQPSSLLINREADADTSSEDRTWAMLAHLSVLLNLVTGFLGGIAAIIIYFIYKDRSRFVAYHAMQSFIFQAITWLGAGLVSGILISLGAGFGFLIIPLLCLIPGFLILLLIPISLIYGVIGGVKVTNGEDFRYWLIGDWVRNILEPPSINA
ncbi:MAG: DUF4870 domain-containing protein [Anaerolineaceae bacterium]|nr:DUF4870 domain-containing protein [Anaerolineaceae bacterium]